MRKEQSHYSDHHELRSLLYATTTTSPRLLHWKTFRSWYLCSTLPFKITCMCILFAYLLSIIIPASCSVWEYHPHLTTEGTGSETMASQTLLFIPVTWGSWEAADLHSVGSRWCLKFCILNKLPGDAAASGLGIMLMVRRS